MRWTVSNLHTNVVFLVAHLRPLQATIGRPPEPQPMDFGDRVIYAPAGEHPSQIPTTADLSVDLKCFRRRLT